MTTDAWLAIAHHIGAFGVALVLAAEWALVRPGLGVHDVRRLVRVDSAYGALAAVVVIAGIARVAAGAQPSDFYTGNPVYWTKMATFVVVGLLSTRPTVRYLAWRRAAADGVEPAEAEVLLARRAVRAQLLLFAAIPVLAALMARGVGR